MVTLHWYNEQHSADYAVRGKDSVILFDENYNEIFRIENIAGWEWSQISLDGGWAPSIPTAEDKLRADVDYLLMITEED